MIRSLGVEMPVEARPSEAFGDLQNRFCAKYGVADATFIVGTELAAPDRPLASFPDLPIKSITVWGRVCDQTQPHLRQRAAAEEPPEPNA
jgi:hypothetical protein